MIELDRTVEAIALELVAAREAAAAALWGTLRTAVVEERGLAVADNHSGGWQRQGIRTSPRQGLGSSLHGGTLSVARCDLKT